jgi:hypothetical protein
LAIFAASFAVKTLTSKFAKVAKETGLTTIPARVWLGVVVQFAQKHPLSFRNRLYRRGICLLPAAKQQIPRFDNAAIRNDNPLEIFKLHHYLAGTKLSKGWEIR